MTRQRTRWLSARPILAAALVVGLASSGCDKAPTHVKRELPTTARALGTEEQPGPVTTGTGPPAAEPPANPDESGDKTAKTSPEPAAPPKPPGVADPSAKSGREDPTIGTDESTAAVLQRLTELGALVKRDSRGDVIGVVLSNTEVTDDDLRLLAALGHIRTLNLTHTRITDSGVRHLKSLTSLKYLYLRGSDTTDAGLAHLRGLTRLVTLCLDETRVTDAGLIHLREMTGLEWLHLQSRAQITDEGLDVISGLTTLTELTLRGPGITDVGMDYLKGMRRLEKLDLLGTKVTDRGLSRLKERLPRCRVFQ